MRMSVWAVLGLAGCLLGCGGAETPQGKPVKVAGKVTLLGEPLKDHQLILYTSSEDVPKDYRNYSAEILPDGTYEIEKVYPGKYTVFFSVKPPDTPMADPGMAMADTAAESPIGAFLSPNSPLSAEVSETSGPLNFELEPMAAMPR